MNTSNFFRLLNPFIILAVLLAVNLQAVSAAPPAPIPLSPAEGATIVTPTFSWSASSGAAKYELEVGPQSDPNTVTWSAQTVNLTITPINAADFPNAPLYWRVRAIDSSAVAGAWSAKINFTKAIPAPDLVSPADTSIGVIVPTFEWLPVEGAAYYRLELSTSPTFVALEASFDTYNTRLTPVSTISHGPHYWRVSGVDADGNVGAASLTRNFTKTINAPVLVSPGVDASVDIPTMEWAAVEGAAYYQVELSTSPTFVPVDLTLTTYNLQITPVNTLALNMYYWRVSGVDADGNVGENNWRRFTLVAPLPPVDPAPILLNPTNGQTIATDPTYQWSRVVGADHYTLVVSTNPAFSSTFSSVTTDYSSYTPAIATSPDAYPNGTYYWRVDAKTSGGTVISTSLSFSFTKQELLPLVAPADMATGLTVDPTYQWSQIVGADHYTLLVSTSPAFSSTFSSVTTDYNSYTPAIATSPDAYPNDTYYWRVDAKTSVGTVIATSEGRSFTKLELLPLVAPADAAAGLTVDPTYQWSQIVGAHHYTLLVSTNPAFSSTFSSVTTDYISYTPAIATSPDAYPNGTYYWRVEAKTSVGTAITTSVSRSFTKQEVLPLIAPPDLALLSINPNFRWNQVTGAHHYTLLVSTSPAFSSTYDSITSDYPIYAPYSPAGRANYAPGIYYWRVQAKTNVGTVITTSDAWTFTILLRKVYLPIILR